MFRVEIIDSRRVRVTKCQNVKLLFPHDLRPSGNRLLCDWSLPHIYCLETDILIKRIVTCKNRTV